MTSVTSKIDQLQKAYDKAIEAQYQEVERERKYFTLEIETLKEELKKVK